MILHTPDLEIDIALVKRDAAATYTRKRRVMRAAVQFGVVSARQARADIREHFAIWSAARKMLRNGCQLLKVDI